MFTYEEMFTNIGSNRTLTSRVKYLLKYSPDKPVYFSEKEYEIFDKVKVDLYNRFHNYADVRAFRLLLDHCTENQKEHLFKYGYINCKGNLSGRLYVIKLGHHRCNVMRFKEYRKSNIFFDYIFSKLPKYKNYNYCNISYGLYSSEYDIPVFDTMLMIKLLLEIDEKLFSSTACNMNCFEYCNIQNDMK